MKMSNIKSERRFDDSMSSLSSSKYMVKVILYIVTKVFQRIAEHKHSAVGKHLKEEHNLQATNLQDQFTVLKKCRTKFDCLIYEMLFIRNMKPKLNTQSDSLRAKLFT